MTGLGADDRYLMVNPYFHMFGLKAGILACLAAGADHAPRAGVRRRTGPGPGRGRTGDGPARTAHALPVDPGPPRPRSLRPVQPARRGNRRGRHPRRAHPARSRRAALLDHHLRLRAHRGGHGDRHRAEDDSEAIATTVGRPRPGFEIRIVDEAGADVAAGPRPARYCSAAASVMAHYLDDPEATAAALSTDGWLRTGDIGASTTPAACTSSAG